MKSSSSPTLVWRSVDHPRNNILSLEATTSLSSSYKLFNEIFNITSGAKLRITNRGYFYTPSRDYFEYVKQFKKKKLRQ